jgi:hypothetical protein
MRRGRSSIYSFPFRFYTGGDLQEVSVENDQERVRIHDPVVLRNGSTTLSPEFPPEEWPHFRWSPWAGRSKRLLPPKTLKPLPQRLGKHAFDGFRIDHWSELEGNRVSRFVTRFLAWLRYQSGQEWIGRYEPHRDASLRYTFEIDAQGRAVDQPYLYGKTHMGYPWTRQISQVMWKAAAVHALQEDAPPEYWSVFFDAAMAVAVSDIRTTVLHLSLALEMARDVHLVKYSKPRQHPLLGEVRGEPFEDDDLLKHLTDRLEAVHPNGANASKALGEPWTRIRQLYIARHHVAHGKPPLAPWNGGVREVTYEDLTEIMKAAFGALQWLEAV